MYLEEIKKQNNASIEKVEFRNKVNGWKNYSMNILFSNVQSYCVHFFEDTYMRMFLGNIDLRPSCYECRFKGLPRQSDMTIGDSWGIENHMPGMDDDKGTSVILVHSSSGGKMLEAIRENLIVREARLDWVLPPTAESRKSVAMHPNRKKFWNGVSKGEKFGILSRYVRKNFIQKAFCFIQYIATKCYRKR